MGVDLGELVEPEEISFADLNDKDVAIDAMNTLYQFLSIIRQRDGTPLKDSSGNVTSHLSGVFYRNINLLENNIRPVYVFDGSTPEIKSKESSKRKKKREEAREEWKKLRDEGKISEAFSKATQSSRLTGDMIEESKKLLDAMGIAYVQAPSEGEAQAAAMVNSDDVYAVGSQDWDCLLFGADKMIKNLTQRKTRKTSGGGTKDISTQLIRLEDVLEQIDITHEKLVWMGILMGTDFNDGLDGVGPKTAVKLIREHGDLWGALDARDEYIEGVDLIRELFLDPDVTDNVDVDLDIDPDMDAARAYVTEEWAVAPDEVARGFERIEESLVQTGLDRWT